MIRRARHDAHVADWLFQRGWDLETRGRLEEALPLYRRAAEMGDGACRMNLARLLTDRDGAEFDEGVRWYRRIVRSGDPSGPWNLAMAYRKPGNRRRYLYWMRRAAAVEGGEAVAILAEIDRRRAAGLAWPLYVYDVLDADTVIAVLSDYRQGLSTAASVTLWAARAARGEIAVRLQDDARGRLTSVLTELAGPARPLTPQRALELTYKLGG